MRVADAVRATSVPHRLRVGDKFVDGGVTLEVTRVPEVVNADTVCVYAKRVDGTRSTAYLIPKSVSLELARK